MPDPESSSPVLPQLLIVEDSLTQRLRLQRLLMKNGYAVLAATHGENALALLAEHEPQLVLTDIRMPGIDGFELCRRIRQGRHGWKIAITLLTALSSPLDLLQALECGADHLLVKPYAEEFLLRQIASELRTRALAGNQEEGLGEGLSVEFAGEQRVISARRPQLLSLLLSTYESAVQTSRDLLKMQEELQAAQVKLRLAEAEPPATP